MTEVNPQQVSAPEADEKAPAATAPPPGNGGARLTFGKITEARHLGLVVALALLAVVGLVTAPETFATASNMVLVQAIQHTHDRVQDGDSLCAPLRSSRVFPSTVLSMIDVGEQSGQLPHMLLKIADNYEDEVDNSIAAALSLLEPVLIIFLALIVSAVVIALFLPIKDIIERGFGTGPGGE